MTTTENNTLSVSVVGQRLRTGPPWSEDELARPGRQPPRPGTVCVSLQEKACWVAWASKLAWLVARTVPEKGRAGGLFF
jgi:hypothetical protein